MKVAYGVGDTLGMFLRLAPTRDIAALLLRYLTYLEVVTYKLSLFPYSLLLLIGKH